MLADVAPRTRSVMTLSILSVRVSFDRPVLRLLSVPGFSALAAVVQPVTRDRRERVVACEGKPSAPNWRSELAFLRIG